MTAEGVVTLFAGFAVGGAVGMYFRYGCVMWGYLLYRASLSAILATMFLLVLQHFGLFDYAG